MNYKFHDLATFVEDVKFLLTHGGGSGMAEHKSITEIVVMWIWTIMVWLLIFLVVYIIYKLIYTGYSRSLVDLTKFKFYNKVDVKKEVGDTNGLLYKNILNLTNDNDVIHAMSIMNVPNIGKNALQAITLHYGGNNDGDKFETAFSDYYSYYNAITDGLSMRHLSSKDKSSKVGTFFKSVMYDYGMFYSKLVGMMQSWHCMFNEGKDEDSRKKLGEEKARLAEQIQEIQNNWNIRPIETNKLFAQSFPEPSFMSKCSTSSAVIVEHELQSSGFEDKQKLISTKEYELKKLQQRPSTNQDAIRELETEINELKLEMAQTRGEAEARAYESVGKGIKPKEHKFTASNSKATDDSSKTIVSYSDASKVHPNFKTAEKGNSLFTVFVPCYELYKQYFILNKETRFAKYLSQPYDMTEDEVIAYIFLVDLDTIYQKKENKGNIKTKVVCESILETYAPIESLSEWSKKIVITEDTPVFLSRYLVIPKDDVIENSARQVAANKTALPDLDAFIKRVRTTTSSIQVASYSFFIAELFVYLSSTSNPYDGYAAKFNELTTSSDDKSNVIAYLNLPLSRQLETNTMTNFGITPELALFLHARPIFTTVFLNTTHDTAGLYDKVMKLAERLIVDNADTKARLKNVTQVTDTFIVKCIRNMKDSLYGLKKLSLTMHIIDLYLNDYKDSVVTKDKKSKIQVSKEGLIDIIAAQNIPYGIPDFFSRLFRPFKVEFIDGKLKSAWVKTFYKPRFKFIKAGKKPDVLMGSTSSNSVSYWREFNAFWIDYLGKLLNKMMKDWKKSFANIGKKDA